MTPAEVEALFTGAEGYRFARWGRPLAPVVFGLADETLPVVKGAIEAVSALARLPIADTDPELGANLMIFFLRDWDELLAVPDLDRLVGQVAPLVARLAAAQTYRTFRFDDAGAIRACFSFVRMGDDLAGMPADTLALSLAVQSVLLWSERAFADRSALAKAPGGGVFLRPEIASVIRAAYDPVLPPAASDAAHSLRLAARIGV